MTTHPQASAAQAAAAAEHGGGSGTAITQVTARPTLPVLVGVHQLWTLEHAVRPVSDTLACVARCRTLNRVTITARVCI